MRNLNMLSVTSEAPWNRSWAHFPEMQISAVPLTQQSPMELFKIYISTTANGIKPENHNQHDVRQASPWLGGCGLGGSFQHRVMELAGSLGDCLAFLLISGLSPSTHLSAWPCPSNLCQIKLLREIKICNEHQDLFQEDQELKEMENSLSLVLCPLQREHFTKIQYLSTNSRRQLHLDEWKFCMDLSRYINNSFTMHKHVLLTVKQEYNFFEVISVLLRFKLVLVSRWLVKDNVICWRSSLCFCDGLCWCFWLETGFISRSICI